MDFSDAFVFILMIIIAIATLYIFYLFIKYITNSWCRFIHFYYLENSQIPETNVIETNNVYTLVIQPDNNIYIGIERN